MEQGKCFCRTLPVFSQFSWRAGICHLLTRNPEIYPWAWPSPSWCKIDLLSIYVEPKCLRLGVTATRILMILSRSKLVSNRYPVLCRALLVQICVCVFSCWLFPWPSLVTYIPWPGEKGAEQPGRVSGGGLRCSLMCTVMAPVRFYAI